MKLSDDAWLFLLEALGEPGERLPSGARQAAAVRELLERDFIDHGMLRLWVTPAGRAHFLGRSRKEARAHA
jgi:hypothetical protein